MKGKKHQLHYYLASTWKWTPNLTMKNRIIFFLAIIYSFLQFVKNKKKMYIEIVSVSTWSFSLPVCNAAQPEDNSALILLNNLQHRQEDHSWSSFHIQICSKGNCGFCSSTHCAHLPSSLTFRQNQMVMGKRQIVKMLDSMTMSQPTHPKDPVRSAREKERQHCVFECVWCAVKTLKQIWNSKESLLVYSKVRDVNRFVSRINKIWFSGA